MQGKIFSRFTQAISLTSKMVVWALVFFSLTETILHIEVIESLLPPPNYGIGFPLMGIKLSLLDKYVLKHGHLDCVFLGSSVVDTGVDPDEVNRGFTSLSNKNLSCFNMGLAYLTVDESDELALFLINRYHPRIVVYFASMIEFGTAANYDIHVYNSPLINYYIDDTFSAEGWLYQSWTGYKYITASNLIWKTEDRRLVNTLAQRLTSMGYSKASHNFSMPTDSQWVKYCGADFKNFESFTRLNSLNQKTSTQIIYVEMPIYSKVFEMCTNASPEKYQDVFWRDIQLITSNTQTSVIRGQTTTPSIIPLTGWLDVVHLNPNAVPAFSFWLGQELAQIIRQK